MFSGERQLREALNRLGISDFEVSWQRLQEAAEDEISDLKAGLKLELKQYDVQFRRHYGRDPDHAEKEPLRPLYNFYKKVRSFSPASKVPATISPMTARQGEENLQKLLEDKETLRQRLRDYKTQFENSTGRTLTQKKEIAPIDQDYRRYKELKAQIERIQSARTDTSSCALFSWYFDGYFESVPNHSVDQLPRKQC